MFHVKHYKKIGKNVSRETFFYETSPTSLFHVKQLYRTDEAPKLW